MNEVQTLQMKMKRYGRLKERIKELFGNQKNFAKHLGKDVSTLNLKLNGKIDWSLSDIREVCQALDISKEDVPDYFFYE